MAACSENGISRRLLLGGAAGAGLLAALPPNEARAVAGGAVRGPREGVRVHTRAHWDARSPRERAQVLDQMPDRIIVHHTATPNTEDSSVAQAYRLSRLVQRFHMDARGWDDIGEQLTISRGGHVMEGRNRTLTAITSGRHVVGAQTQGHNHHTIGIENEGTYSNARVPDQLWSSLVDTCMWLCDVYDLDPFRAIRGHRDFGGTECPGDVLYGRLPELRRAVARGLRKMSGRMSLLEFPALDGPVDDVVSPLLPEAAQELPVWPDGLSDAPTP